MIAPPRRGQIFKMNSSFTNSLGQKSLEITLEENENLLQKEENSYDLKSPTKKKPAQIEIQNEDKYDSEEKTFVQHPLTGEKGSKHNSSHASLSRSNTVNYRSIQNRESQMSKASMNSKLLRTETIAHVTVQQAAPCDELLKVWSVFTEQHQQTKEIPKIILKLQALPNLSQLTFLQLEGQSIQKVFQLLKPCHQLQALFLGNNRIITRDIHFVKFLSKLRKLDLSANEISFLPEQNVLKNLTKLEFLLLHQNQLVGFRQIEELCGLKNLKHLTLHGNPCAKTTGFRKHLIDTLPNLYCLDEFIVFDFERKDFEALYPKDSFRGERRAQLKRFQPYSHGASSWKGFSAPKVSTADSDSSDSQHANNLEDSKPKKRMTLAYDNKTIMNHLYQEHYALRRKFEWCSPGLTVAKTIKMFLQRRRYKRKCRMMKLLYFMLGRWFKRMLFQKLKRKLGLNDNSNLRKLGKIRFIQKWWKNYLRVQRLKKFVALRLQSNYRMISVQNRVLLEVLGLKQALKAKKNQKILRQGTLNPIRARKSFFRQNTFKLPQNDRLLKDRPSQVTETRSPRNMLTSPPLTQSQKTCLEIKSRLSGGQKLSETVQKPPDSQKDYQTPQLLFSRKQLAICESIGIDKLFIKMEQSNDYILLQVDQAKTPLTDHRRSLLLSMINTTNRMVKLLDMRNKRNREKLRVLSISSPFSGNQVSEKEDKVTPIQNSKEGNSVKRKLQRQLTREGGFQFRRINRLDSIDDQPEKLNIVPVVTSLKPTAPTSKAYNGKRSGRKPSIRSGGFSDHASQVGRNWNQRKQVTSKINPNNALVVCTFENDQALTQALNKIMMHNRHNKNTLFTFFEPWLVRYWARIKIQRWYRGVIFRHKQIKLFQEGTLKLLPGINPVSSTIKNTMYAHYALMSRAVMKIQRSFRNWRFRARILALEHIANYASTIESNVLYLEQTLYTHLGEIERLSLRTKTDIKGTLSTFKERNFQYRLDERDYFITASFLPNQDPAGRYTKFFLPAWFNKKAGTSVSSIESAFIGQRQFRQNTWNKKKQLSHLPKTDMHSLIHLHPFNAISKKAPCVQSLNQITNGASKSNVSFVKIIHTTAQEARNRAVLIALRTCNYLRSFNSFVRMYTEDQLKNETKASAQITSLLKFYKIPELLNQNALNADAQLQTHGGIIIKREDPYRTILRARPKIHKSNFKRFIVLQDSDPAEVERRIGEAMLNDRRTNYQRQRMTTTRNKYSLRIKDVTGTSDEKGTFNSSSRLLQHGAQMSFNSNDAVMNNQQNDKFFEERSINQSVYSPRIQILRGEATNLNVLGKAADRTQQSPVPMMRTVREVNEEGYRVSNKFGRHSPGMPMAAIPRYRSNDAKLQLKRSTNDELHQIDSKSTSSNISTDSGVSILDQLQGDVKSLDTKEGTTSNVVALKKMVTKVENFNKKLQKKTTKDPLFMNIYMQQLMPKLSSEYANKDLINSGPTSPTSSNAKIVTIPDQITTETKKPLDDQKAGVRLEQIKSFHKRQKQAFNQAQRVKSIYLKTQDQIDARKKLTAQNQDIIRKSLNIDERDTRIEEHLRSRAIKRQFQTQKLLVNVKEQLSQFANEQKGFLSVRQIKVQPQAKVMQAAVLPKISAQPSQKDINQFKFHTPKPITINIKHLNRLSEMNENQQTTHLLNIQNFQRPQIKAQNLKKSAEIPPSLLHNVFTKDGRLTLTTKDFKPKLLNQSPPRDQRNQTLNMKSTKSEAKLSINSKSGYLNIDAKSEAPLVPELIESTTQIPERSQGKKSVPSVKQIAFAQKQDKMPLRHVLFQSKAPSADQLRLQITSLQMPVYSRAMKKMIQTDQLDQLKLKTLQSLVSERSHSKSPQGQSFDHQSQPPLRVKSTENDSQQFENCRIQTLCALPGGLGTERGWRQQKLSSRLEPQPSLIEQELLNQGIVRVNIFNTPLKMKKTRQAAKVLKLGSNVQNKVLRSNHFVLHKILHSANGAEQKQERQTALPSKYKIAHLNLKTPPSRVLATQQVMAPLEPTTRTSIQHLNLKQNQSMKVSMLNSYKSSTLLSLRDAPLKMSAGQNLRVTSKRLN